MKPVVVAPCHRPLLGRLRDLPVVLRISDPARAAEAVAAADEFHLNLTCVYLETGGELADLPLDGLPETAPLAVRVSASGPMRRIAPRLDRLQRLNARFYLPARTRAQAAEIRVLSSLGLHTAALLVGPEPADWEALCELAVYSCYNAAPHGDIDPFSFIARRYDLHHLPLDPRAVWFEAPGKFVEADETGALSAPRFDGGLEPFPLAIEELGSEAVEIALNEARSSWREFFITPHPCQACEGFRVCLGLFAAEAGEGCRGLMTEALEGAERAAAPRVAPVEPWQP